MRVLRPGAFHSRVSAVHRVYTWPIFTIPRVIFSVRSGSMSQAKPEKQIDYVEFPVKDITRIKEFYGSIFGWKFEDYGPEYTSFFDGRLAGGFTRERTEPAPGVLVVIYASDLMTIKKAIETAGGKIVKDIFSFPGGRRFHFSDPSGNELAVWSDVL